MTDEVCNYDPSLQKCGISGTPIPVLPPIAVNSDEFDIVFIFSYIIPGSYNPPRFGNKLMGSARALAKTIYTSTIELYPCTYLNKNVYNIQPIFKDLFGKLKLNSNYPILKSFIFIKASILDKPLADPGRVNQTTIQPINTDAEILGYDNLKIINSIWINSALQVTVKLRGLKA